MCFRWHYDVSVQKLQLHQSPHKVHQCCGRHHWQCEAVAFLTLTNNSQCTWTSYIMILEPKSLPPLSTSPSPLVAYRRPPPAACLAMAGSSKDILYIDHLFINRCLCWPSHIDHFYIGACVRMMYYYDILQSLNYLFCIFTLVCACVGRTVMNTHCGEVKM